MAKAEFVYMGRRMSGDKVVHAFKRTDLKNAKETYWSGVHGCVIGWCYPAEVTRKGCSIARRPKPVRTDLKVPDEDLDAWRAQEEIVVGRLKQRNAERKAKADTSLKPVIEDLRRITASLSFMETAELIKHLVDRATAKRKS